MKRRTPCSFPYVRLRRNSGKTLQAQLSELLRAAVPNLGPGARLPSTRALAQHLSVSRNTVLNVYEELALEGLVASRTGSGTRVRKSAASTGPSFPVNLDMRRILKDSQYPGGARRFLDPDGNMIYVH